MSPWSRRVKMGIPLLPTEVQSPPRAGPRRPGGATWTRMMTWTSATQRSPHPQTHRGDPAETHQDPLGEAHRDPRAEDHQDPLEDIHGWTPRRQTSWRRRTPWTGWAQRRPSWRTPWRPRRPTRRWCPGDRLAVDRLPPQEGPGPRARGGHGQKRGDPHRQGRRRRTEGAGYRQDGDGQDRQGRHRRPEGAGHRHGRDQAAEHRHQRPAAEVGQAGRPGDRRQRPATPGVRLAGRQLGTWTSSGQSPRPRRSPQESPQRQCPLSKRPLSSQRESS